MSLQDLQNRLAQVHASKAKAEAVFTALENPGLLDAVDNNTLDQEQLGWPDVVSPFFSSCASEKSGRQTYKLGNLDRILHLADARFSQHGTTMLSKPIVKQLVKSIVEWLKSCRRGSQIS